MNAIQPSASIIDIVKRSFAYMRCRLLRQHFLYQLSIVVYSYLNIIQKAGAIAEKSLYELISNKGASPRTTYGNNLWLS